MFCTLLLYFSELIQLIINFIFVCNQIFPFNNESAVIKNVHPIGMYINGYYNFNCCLISGR